MNANNFGELYIILNNRKKILEFEYIGNILLCIILYIFFITGNFNTGIIFTLVTSIIMFLCINSAIKKYALFKKRVKYMESLLKNDIQPISIEIKDAIYNSQKESIQLKNYYIDIKNCTFVKYTDVINILKKMSLNILPPNYGLIQYIRLNTKQNVELDVINWSFSRLFPEDDEIYNILNRNCSNASPKKNNTK